MKMGWDVERVHELSKIDPWFLEQIAELVEGEGLPQVLGDVLKPDLDWLLAATGGVVAERVSGDFDRLKQLGYSDQQLSFTLAWEPGIVRAVRGKFQGASVQAGRHLCCRV